MSEENILQTPVHHNTECHDRDRHKSKLSEMHQVRKGESEVKRKISAWHKVKLFYRWIKMVENYGIIEVCGFCDSPKIDIAESNVNDRIYTAIYECKSCRGKATVREVWYKEA